MSVWAQIPPAAQAALITAAVTVAGILLKDLLVTLWHSKRQEKLDELVVFQRYADPLGSALASLVYRLNEILHDPGRGAYLRGDAPVNPYNTHKRLSTIYRIVAVIAWMRAIRREQSYLRTSERAAASQLHEALNAYEAALADGPSVEIERLKRFCSLWGLRMPEKDAEAARLGVVVEQVTDRVCADLSLAKCTDATPHGAIVLCQAVAKELCHELGASPIPEGAIRETAERGHQILNIREAWVFRDWQSAIGDLMLLPLAGASRRFDVIGYGDFEDKYIQRSEPYAKWLDRVADVIDDLDVRLLQSDDARVVQIQNLTRAVAQTILALAAVDHGAMFSSGTLSLAKRLTSLD